MVYVGQRGRCTWARVLVGTAVVLFGLAARQAIGQDVGEVVWADASVALERQQERFAAAPSTALRVGDKLSTTKPGAARLLFYGEVVGKIAAGLPQVLNYMNVGDNALAIIARYDYDPAGPRARFVLERGTAYALFAEAGGGAHYEITTPNAVAIARGTAFVVTYDEVTDTTEVVCLSGKVDVRSVARWEEDAVTLSARQMTTLTKGAWPPSVDVVSERRYQQSIEGLEFIGAGRGESLGQAARAGQPLPASDQFSLVHRPHPGTLDPCPWPSAPTCVKSEPLGGLGVLDVGF